VCTQTDTGEPVCISGTKPPKKKKKNKKKKKGNPFKKLNISNFQDLRLEFDAWCIDDNICMVPNYFLKCNFSRKGIIKDIDPKSSVMDLDLDPWDPKFLAGSRSRTAPRIRNEFEAKNILRKSVKI
jgi:hypothetical protein